MTWTFAGTISLLMCTVTICIAALVIVAKGMRG